MRTAAILLCICIVAGPVDAQTVPATVPSELERGRGVIDVVVDPRVELICIIMHLSGAREYNQPRVASYAEDVAEHFGAFKDHAVVRLVRQLRQSRGISYDAPMSLAVHLKEGRSFELAVPLDPWPNIDVRWRPADVQRFLREARRFAEQSRFDDFFDAHRELYDLAAQRMRETLQQHAKLNWFDEFFGARPQAQFRLILGMLNGGSCYGAAARVDGEEHLYCILGVWLTDEQGQPRFGADVIPTVMHEFCHSYVNPLINKHLDELQRAGDQLFRARRAQMQRQAYGNGTIVLYESLVRACVVRYIYANHGSPAGVAEIVQQKGRGFTWIDELSAALDRYEAQREKYPTLDEFMPELIKVFDTIAARLPEARN